LLCMASIFLLKERGSVWGEHPKSLYAGQEEDVCRMSF